jgi:hypothetical protein
LELSACEITDGHLENNTVGEGHYRDDNGDDDDKKQHHDYDSIHFPLSSTFPISD